MIGSLFSSSFLSLYHASSRPRPVNFPFFPSLPLSLSLSLLFYISLCFLLHLSCFSSLPPVHWTLHPSPSLSGFLWFENITLTSLSGFLFSFVFLLSFRYPRLFTTTLVSYSVTRDVSFTPVFHTGVKGRGKRGERGKERRLDASKDLEASFRPRRYYVFHALFFSEVGSNAA